MTKPAVWPGRPYPLGASWDGEGVNFALFSEHAEQVELCLFDPTGRHEIERIVLRERTDHVWHAYLPEARPGWLYGYRVHGPYQPEQGHRFNAHKLLLDPYAKSYAGNLKWSDAHFGYRIGGGREDLSFSTRNNATGMPKCQVIDPAFTWGDDRPPRTPWQDTVIYELHVKGFTMQHPAIPPQLRGTYAGLASPAVVEYLQWLGVTAVELLPVHAFVDDRHLLDQGLRNYWGYSTMGFFTPSRRYSASGPVHEFKSMVKALHSAGIEVLLDVVFNHTAEGNQMGPTLSFRGVDNASYYRLVPDNPRYYMDYTGCGNSLDTTHPRVLQLVLDCLRYWVLDMHVDGFRFDLATTLTRGQNGVEQQGAFMNAIRQDPVLSQVKLIAEPWDLGEDGYQVGRFPPGWSEWNDRYRDGMRDFWRGQDNMLGELASRLAGSSDLYQDSGRRPYASLNFITAHDGFTLRDLVSYNDKHNEANGEDNRDGHSHNRSWNCGVEGPTDDPDIQALRVRQQRNFLATLLLSQGVPMLLAGDELNRTQQGNNNTYCQDNSLNWINWELDDGSRALLHFAQQLIGLRKHHCIFRRRRFFQGQWIGEREIKDITWLAPSGEEMNEHLWGKPGARCMGMYLAGHALEQQDAHGHWLMDDDFLLLLNADEAATPFVLPGHAGDSEYIRVLDTSEPEAPERPASIPYLLQGRTLALLTRRRRIDGSPPSPARPTPGLAQPPETNAMHRYHAMPFGAELFIDGRVRFRLWAPGAAAVELCLEKDQEHILPMTALGDGWYELLTEQARVGDLYRFRIDGELKVPDPASRYNPQDIHGPSQVLDPRAFHWQDGDWNGQPWENVVVYELHVGAFTPAGGFAALKNRLDYLAGLGVTAIELMPVADFPGRRNWGYDGVLPFAPDASYGHPDELKDLIQTAHSKGLMVFLDVVYNHFGPEGNYLYVYARDQFFTERHHTPWGAAINFDGPDSRNVRDFFIHNALYWLEEFHFDGLRLDAVHAIMDDSTPDILEELAQAVRQGPGQHRQIHLILENDLNRARYLARDNVGAPCHYHAQWNDDIHHVLHSLLTHETDGYYVDYAERPVWQLGRCLSEGFAYQNDPSPFRQGEARGEPSRHLPGTAFVNFIQNHDQVGNRAFGERISMLAEAQPLRAAIATYLLAPSPPLLFMGEEFAAATPFLFFCDFGPELAASVTEGRRREFDRFEMFNTPEAQERIPDPNDPQTFKRSKLDWSCLGQAPHAEWLDYYRQLLILRHREITPRLAGISGGQARFDVLGEHGLLVQWPLGDGSMLSLLGNYGNAPLNEVTPPAGEMLYASQAQLDASLAQSILPPWSVAWLLLSS